MAKQISEIQFRRELLLQKLRDLEKTRDEHIARTEALLSSIDTVANRIVKWLEEMPEQSENHIARRGKEVKDAPTEKPARKNSKPTKKAAKDK